MAHLSDMEELVGSIENLEIRDYMNESLSCYMAGAYRASVVLSFIALFDDILAKLGQLGKVNAKAKTIYEDASQKRADQQVFETFLIDQLKAKSLFSSLDAGFLEILRTLRNKAAHPSGHHSSAEEARFVFYEAISRFLSKPMLSTTQLADEILANVGGENYFPSNQVKAIAEVVKKDLENIHQDTYPYLISKLLEKTSNPPAKVANNSGHYLSGLARAGDKAALAAIRKYVIEKFCANNNYRNIILSMLCANGSLLQELHAVTYQRLAVFVDEQIIEVDATVEHSSFHHPARMFVSLFQANEGEFVVEKLGKQLTAFLDRFPYSGGFNSNAMKFPAARQRLLDKLYENAGSDQFAIANEFVKNVGDLDNLIAAHMSNEEAFKLLIRVMYASNIGAYAAIDLRNSNFASAPQLRARASQFLIADEAEAHKLAAKILSVSEGDLGIHLEKLTPA